jgi:hypothetical protein
VQRTAAVVLLLALLSLAASPGPSGGAAPEARRYPPRAEWEVESEVSRAILLKELARPWTRDVVTALDMEDRMLVARRAGPPRPAFKTTSPALPRAPLLSEGVVTPLLVRDPAALVKRPR